MTEDEYKLEEIYEVAVGDNGINRYTHEEFIILLTEMQDCYEWVCNFKNWEAMYADLRELRGEDEPTNNDGGIPIAIHRNN